jgi:mannose-6-phosphate isomerase-like protein (cupin superfamily)
MRFCLLACSVLIAIWGAITLAQAPATGDPNVPMFWSARQLKEIDERLATRVSPQTNMSGQRMNASVSMIYRTGPSQAEAHEQDADFILVREGEGAILVGGKIIGGKTERPGEIRGDSIEGGTRYAVAAGDSLYIPANTPHQFFVEKGKHWVITMVKIPPRP